MLFMFPCELFTTPRNVNLKIFKFSSSKLNIRLELSFSGRFSCSLFCFSLFCFCRHSTTRLLSSLHTKATTGCSRKWNSSNTFSPVRCGTYSENFWVKSNLEWRIVQVIMWRVSRICCCYDSASTKNESQNVDKTLPLSSRWRRGDEEEEKKVR